MHLGVELGLERPHDSAMPREPGHGGKAGSGDTDAKMRLSALAPAGMTLMS